MVPRGQTIFAQTFGHGIDQPERELVTGHEAQDPFQTHPPNTVRLKNRTLNSDEKVR